MKHKMPTFSKTPVKT